MLLIKALRSCESLTLLQSDIFGNCGDQADSLETAFTYIILAIALLFP